MILAGLDTIVGQGTTGVVVVAGLVVYELVKKHVAKRNGKGETSFTDADRDALICGKRATIETAVVLERIAVVLDKIDERTVRIDERTKGR